MNTRTAIITLIIRHTRSKRIGFDERATFIDGPYQFRFGDYKPECGTDPAFPCEDYAFDPANTLREPKIIEVCGRRFLYSNMSFWCNGVGCSIVKTFIYDLQSHRPVFLETFHIEYDGFLLSDFDGDNRPDLLVISQTNHARLKGFAADKLRVRIEAFDFNSGKPVVKNNKWTRRPYSYELYTVLESSAHERHSGKLYSMIRNEWIGE